MNIQHKFLATQPQVGFFTVTPVEADFYLRNHNTHNRNLNEKVVHKFSQEITNNAWRITNQGIGFSTTGVLIDGQHRLAACVKSDRPIEVLVVYGLEDEAQMKIDSGTIRTHMQRLLLGGKTIQTVAYRVAYNLSRLDHSWQWNIADSIVESKIESKVAILNYIISKLDYEDCPKCFKRVGFLTAVAVYLEKDEAKAKSYFEEVVSVTGAGICPIAAVTRTYLMKSKSANGGLAKDDYLKTVQLIHCFHGSGEVPKKLMGREIWEF